MTTPYIEKPIFIVGSGRSGTTLLYNLLAVHPDVCWFSEFTDKYPDNPYGAVLQKLLQMPIIGIRLQRAVMSESAPFFIKPSEGSTIYDNYSGFVRHKRSTEKDRSGEVENKFKLTIKKHLMATGKSRFINKQPANTQRIRLIHALFPDAYFVHIIRDGRGLANSLIQTDWWQNTQLWWMHGQKPSEIKRYKRNPIKLCALHWKHNVIEVRRSKKLLGKRYMEIRYEKLISDPRGAVKNILQFCELPLVDQYIQQISKKFPNMNNKWKKELTVQQQKLLQTTLNPFLRELGYLGKQ